MSFGDSARLPFDFERVRCTLARLFLVRKLVRSVGYASWRQQTPQRAARYIERLGTALDLR